MHIRFEPRATPRRFSPLILKFILGLQRFVGRRGAFRAGRYFTRYENWGRPLDERISELFVRLPGVQLRGGPGTLAFCGGVFLEEDVQLSVGRGTIRLGDGCRILKGSVVTLSAQSVIEIGSGSTIGPYCVLYAHAHLSIGDNVMLGPKCSIIAETHGTDPTDVRYQLQPITGVGITIEDNVWLGAHVCVIDGVVIGEGSIVSAGSTVMRTIPPFSLVAGVPGRVIRSLRPVAGSAAGDRPAPHGAASV